MFAFRKKKKENGKLKRKHFVEEEKKVWLVQSYPVGEP